MLPATVDCGYINHGNSHRATSRTGDHRQASGGGERSGRGATNSPHEQEVHQP